MTLAVLRTRNRSVQSLLVHPFRNARAGVYCQTTAIGQPNRERDGPLLAEPRREADVANGAPRVHSRPEAAVEQHDKKGGYDLVGTGL